VGLLSLAGVFSAFRAHVRSISAAEPSSSATVSATAPSKAPPPVLTSSPPPPAPPPDPCRELFNANKLEEAQKTCTKTLENTDEPSARASLLTTLGLVEEKRNAKKAAEHQFLTALTFAYSDDTAQALARVGGGDAKARTGKATISVHGAKRATVRSEPKKSGSKVGMVKVGTEVDTIATVTQKSDGWTSVVFDDGKHRGWIRDSALSGGSDPDEQ
jgi:Bacterial SH3 domain